MLELLLIHRLLRRRSTPPLVAPAGHPSGDSPREAEQADSSEILAQAQWLYEQHERRVQNCQNLAVAMMTVVGAIIALSPKALPEEPACWHYLAVGITAIAAIGTAVQCVRVLVPRDRVNGLPALQALRKLAGRHARQERIPVPVTQFAVDLLNPLKPDQESPLSEAASDAARRTDALIYAFWWFGGTFVLVIAMSTMFALVK